MTYINSGQRITASHCVNLLESGIKLLMPTPEQFKILKEIESLHQDNFGYQDEIDGQNLRIKKLNKQKENSKEKRIELEKELKSNQQQLTQDENTLAGYDKKLEKDKSQIGQLIDAHQIESMQKEISNLVESKEATEARVMDSMEKIESLESEHQQVCSFLAGIDSGIQEVSEDANEHIAPLLDKIEKNKKRISTYQNELDADIFKRYMKVHLSKGKLKSLSYLVSSCCQVCQMQLSKIEESEVSVSLKLKTCSGCGRILIPSHL